LVGRSAGFGGRFVDRRFGWQRHAPCHARVKAHSAWASVSGFRTDLSGEWESVRRISGGGIMLIMLKLFSGRKANVVNGASSMAAESAPLRRAEPLCESEPERIIGPIMRRWPVRPSRLCGCSGAPRKSCPPQPVLRSFLAKEDRLPWEYTCNRRQQTRFANLLMISI
jgi:hypothetical protein